jgi:hypothetical protein
VRWLAYVIARRWRPESAARKRTSFWAAASTSIAVAATPVEWARRRQQVDRREGETDGVERDARGGAATSIVTVARPSKVSVAACGTSATS